MNLLGSAVLALALSLCVCADVRADVRLVEGYDLHNQPSSSVGTNGRDYVHIEMYGEISEGDLEQLQQLIPVVKRRTVALYSVGLPQVDLFLDSPGGNVVAALGLGRLIRREMLTTNIDVDRSCSSACVLVFSAGVKRVMWYGAKLGLHRPTFPQQLFAGLGYGESQDLYRKLTDDVSGYLKEMGASPTLIDKMLSISSADIYFIGEQEAKEYGIAGDFPAFNEWIRARQVKDFGKEITP